MTESPTTAHPGRPMLMWGRRGLGIDVKQNCRMYDFKVSTVFIGIIVRDTP